MNFALSKLAVSVTLCASIIGGYAAQAAAAEKEIVIGGSLPLSGQFQKIGDMTKKGYELAFDLMEKEGKLKDYKVALVIEDDQQNPTQTNNIWNRIITDRNAVAMLGPYGSTTSIVGSNVAERHQVPHVLNSASSYKVHERNAKHLYNAYASLSIVRDPLIAEFINSVNGKKVVIFAEDGEFGTEGSRRLTEYAPKNGFEVVQTELIKGGTPDFSPTLLKFKGSQPDVFVGYFYINDWVKILRQSKEIDFNPSYYIIPPMGDAIDKKFIDAMGKDADYPLEVNVWLPDLDSEQNKLFVSKFREKFGEEPDYNAAAGYVAAQVLINALKNAENPGDRASVNAALRGSKPETLFGTLQFDEKGRGIGAKLFLTQTINGKPVVVFPKEVATAPAVPTPAWKQR